MQFPGWFAVVVGVAMLGQWTVSLAGGTVPELQTEPVRLGFHLVGEALTAVLLIVSGTAALRGRNWARSLLLVALGMLLYTAVVSPGYFAQRGEYGLVGMFAVIAVLACGAVSSAFRARGELR